MDIVTITGYLAAGFTTISYLPQVYRTLRTRSTRDLSFGMVFMLLTGIALWLAYGILGQLMPLILANSVTLVLVLILFICKLIYK